MKIISFKALIISLSVIASCATTAFAADSVCYNIGGWSQFYGNLPASYVDGSDALVSASSLSPTGGLVLPGDSNVGGTGKFWFDGWSDSYSNPALARSIQFSITANQDISLGTMSYSWFSGNWSDHWFGPQNLDVWASRDNWATSQEISHRGIANSYPDSPYSTHCIDDLSSLGILNAGETVSVRFIGYYGSWAAGFVHEYADQQDLFVNIVPVPEPSTLGLLAVGADALLIRRRR
jgi:hypothetical protein